MQGKQDGNDLTFEFKIRIFEGYISYIVFYIRKNILSHTLSNN
jgi:hypothetical protein